MKYTFWIIMLATLISAGCDDGAAGNKIKKPTFMPFCYREEIVSEVYYIPDMTTPQAAKYLDARLRAIPGYVKGTANLSKRTLTINYASTTVRKMNFEEAIALAGFKVNNRPAKPNTNLPAGIK